MRGKGKARGAGRGKASKPSSQSAQEAHRVDAASLPWAAIPLPLEAQASGGQTESDFLQGLDFDDDDFMGLKEVEGVDVVRQDDGAMSFIVKGGAAAGTAKQKAKAKAKGPDKDLPPSKKIKAAEDKGDGEGDERFGVATPSAEKDDGTKELPAIDWDGVLESERRSGDKGQREEKGQEEDELDVDFNVLDAGGLDDEGELGHDQDVPRLAHWEKLDIGLDDCLKRALRALNFDKPTKIQALALPHALKSSQAQESQSRDVVGIAQTGSGKTLSYGLPMLNWIATTEKEDRKIKYIEGQDAQDGDMTRLTGLVLTPTRELALQVSKHLEALIRASSPSATKKWAHVATLTGGISEEKQRRLVLGHDGGGTDIIVATPGRLWDMCKSVSRSL